MTDAIDWPEFEEYRLARDAVAVLAGEYDQVRVERKPPMGALQWRAECWSRPRCERCGGCGIEPDHRVMCCTKCNGVGRQHGPLSLKKVFVVHSDGRIRQERQA